MFSLAVSKWSATQKEGGVLVVAQVPLEVSVFSQEALQVAPSSAPSTTPARCSTVFSIFLHLRDAVVPLWDKRLDAPPCGPFQLAQAQCQEKFGRK